LLDGDQAIPEAALESFTGLSLLPRPGSILTLNSVEHPLLRARTQYWVVMTAPDLTNSEGGWNTGQGSFGVVWRDVETGWHTPRGGPNPAFDVTGTTGTVAAGAPEPSAFGLALTGLLVVWVVRRWQRRSKV